MNHFGHTTITPNIDISEYSLIEVKKRGQCAPLSIPLLGLKFRVVMSTNQEISHSDIFLEISVIVKKYSFKLNNGDPLCEKSPKK